MILETPAITVFFFTSSEWY